MLLSLYLNCTSNYYICSRVLTITIANLWLYDNHLIQLFFIEHDLSS